MTCLPLSLSSDQSSCSCFSEIIIESPFTRWLVNIFLRHFYTDLCSHILVSLKVSQTAHSLYLIPLYCTNNSTILLLAYGMWCMYLIITVLKITISHLERWFTIIIVATVCVSKLGPSIRIYITETLEKMQFFEVRVCGTLTCAPWAVHDAVDKIDKNSSTSSLTHNKVQHVWWWARL